MMMAEEVESKACKDMNEQPMKQMYVRQRGNDDLENHDLHR